MDNRLWTPPKVMPTAAKKDGGSYFDDEMEDTETKQRTVTRDAARMIDHLQQRPDHVVFVGSAQDRGKLRAVFNHFKAAKLLTYNPVIRIDYGVPDGTIRIDEDRSA
jgi:hypothetical protein